MQELHRLGEDDAMALDQGQWARAIALEGRHDVARGVGEPLQGVPVNFRGDPSGAAQPLEEIGGSVGCGAAWMPDEREEKIVGKEPFVLEPCAITGVERGGERRTELAFRVNHRPTAHEMRPQRQTLVGEIA